MTRQLVLMNQLIKEISMGLFGSDIKVDNYTNSGVPVLNGANISGVKLIEDSFNYVTHEKAKFLKKANAKRGDIVITHRGTLGKICYIPEDSKFENYVISQSQFRVTLKTDLVDPRYFVYYFHTSEGQKRLLANKSYVGVPALAQATSNFRLIDFPLPELKKQKKIADILSAFDAKIELNNRINAELESLAKTIYDYWFVQFDFPNADGKPYKSSDGEMVYVEGGGDRAIPAGWEIKTLGEVLTIVRGASPRPIDDFLSDQGLPWIKISDATSSNNRFIIETKQFITPEGISGTRHIPPNTLILSNSATLGLPRIVKIDAGVHDGWLIILNYTNGLTQEFMYNYFLFEYLKIVCLGNGSIFKNLKTEYVKGLKIVLPPKHILDIASEKFRTISELIFVKTKENQQLTQLRNWLLPMLMNGQVSIK